MGPNKTVGWAWDITNLFGGLVWSSAGISAVLLLFQTKMENGYK